MVAEALQEERHALLVALEVLPRPDGIVEGGGLDERRGVALAGVVVVVKLPDLARDLTDFPSGEACLCKRDAVPLLGVPQLIVLLLITPTTSERVQPGVSAPQLMQHRHSHNSCHCVGGMDDTLSSRCQL